LPTELPSVQPSIEPSCEPTKEPTVQGQKPKKPTVSPTVKTTLSQDATTTSKAVDSHITAIFGGAIGGVFVVILVIILCARRYNSSQAYTVLGGEGSKGGKGGQAVVVDDLVMQSNPSPRDANTSYRQLFMNSNGTEVPIAAVSPMREWNNNQRNGAYQVSATEDHNV